MRFAMANDPHRAAPCRKSAKEGDRHPAAQQMAREILILKDRRRTDAVHHGFFERFSNNS
jgi:hypothetical protein